MIVHPGVHGSDHQDVIHNARKTGEQFREVRPRLTMPLEFPW